MRSRAVTAAAARDKSGDKATGDNTTTVGHEKNTEMAMVTAVTAVAAAVCGGD